MKIAHYRSDTGTFISISDADVNPQNSNLYIIPAYATPDLPPEYDKVNEIPIYLDSEGRPPIGGTVGSGSWEVIPVPEIEESEQNDPDEYDSDGVPLMITRAQGKAALLLAGLWATVESVVASIEDELERKLTEVAVYEQVTWLRDSPTLNNLAAQVGLNKEDVDQLFMQAKNIIF